MIQVVIDGSKAQLVPLRQLMLMLGIPLDQRGQKKLSP
jgi:hypothetical protein